MFATSRFHKHSMPTAWCAVSRIGGGSSDIRFNALPQPMVSLQSLNYLPSSHSGERINA